MTKRPRPGSRMDWDPMTTTMSINIVVSHDKGMTRTGIAEMGDEFVGYLANELMAREAGTFGDPQVIAVSLQNLRDGTGRFRSGGK